MNPITKLRFRKNPPADVPPEGFVDLVWDRIRGSFVVRQPDKSTSPISPDFTPESIGAATPESVEAQVAEAVVSRQRILNAQILGGLHKRLADRIGTSAAVITLANFGDSYAQAPAELMRRDWGGSWGYISSVTASWTLGGGATIAATDYSKNLNGVSIDLTAGQTAQLPSTSYLLGSRLVCVYQVDPAAGSFKVQYEKDKNGTWVDALTVDAAVSVNGANSAAMAVSTQTPATFRVRAVGVSGTCRILALGVDFGNSLANRHGVRLIDANLGGSTVAQWATPPQHIWDAYFAGANGTPPDLAFFKGDDAASQWVDNFAGLVTKLRAASANTEIVVQGRHPTTAAPSNTALHADDISIGDLCASNSWIYIPSRLFFPDAATMQAQGLLRTGDGGVHLEVSQGTSLQDRITHQHLYPINQAIPVFSGNASDKRFLSGYNGVVTPDDSHIPQWLVRGAMRTEAGQIGLQVADGNSSTQPGAFYGLRTSALAGAETHKGSMSLTANDLNAMLFKSDGNALLGGGPYSAASVTHPMTDALTVLCGVFGEGGINLGIGASPHASIVPWQVRRDASITSSGTQVMRMHRLHPKFEYLGGDAASVTGTFTLAAGVATINTTAAATNDHVNVTIITPGGTMGNHYKVTITNGTSITITAIDLTGATVTTDTSSGTWEIAKGRF